MNIQKLFLSMVSHAAASSSALLARAGRSKRWLAAGMSALAVTAPAATINWDVTKLGTQDWNAAANWSGGAIPGSADTAVFGTTTGATALTIDSGRSILSMLFNGTNTAGLYTIGSAGANAGPALNLVSGGNITVAAATQTVTTINAPLIIQPASGTSAATYTLTNNATDAQADPNNFKLNVTGNISAGTTTSTATLNLTGTAGSRNVDTAGNIISGLISNGGAAGGLSVSITGTTSGDRGAWALTNVNNSFTGNVTVTSGTLLFSSIADSGVASAIGAGNTLTMVNGAQVKYTGPAASTNRTITGSGSLFSQGTGALTLTGTFLPVGTITFRGSQNFIIESVIGGTGSLNRTDTGTVFLNNVNTFTGNISAQDGAFRFATIADKNQASSIGAGTQINLGQNSSTVGRIEFTGANGGSSNRDIVLTNGADASSSGNGRINNTVAGQTLTLSGTVKSSNATATFLSSLDLTGVGNGVMSGIIGGTSSNASATIALQLTKTGTGTWALSNANNYSRGTLISAGTLLATNTTGSATGSGNVITSGTGVLGGTGIVTGGAGSSITIASGTRLMVGNTHQTAAGVTGSAGYIGGVANLRLGTNATVAITLAGTLQFDLFTNAGASTLGQADLLTLSTTSTAITLGGIISVADVTTTHAGWKAGRWQLIDWTNTASATKTGAFTFDLPSTALAAGYEWNTSTFLTDGIISIQKSINHTWLGTTDNSWGTATNWEIGTIPGSGNDVFFLNATSNLVTAINGDRSARNLYFSGESNFTINTGTGGVLYSHGTLLEVLGGTQTFGAQFRIANGTSSTYTIYNDGTLNMSSAAIMWHRQNGSNPLLNLTFDGSGNTTVNHFQRRANSYDMNLVKNGTGTLTITGLTTTEATTEAGSITGTTTINAGKVRINNEGNLGSNPAAFNAAHLTVNGGTLAAYANVVMDDANRGVTFGANGATVEVEPTFTFNIATPVTGSGAFTKTGTGILTLSNSGNDFSGTTLVQAGVLQVATTGKSGTGAMTVASAAQLSGTGIIQSSSFSLLSGGTVSPGDLTSGVVTGNGTLTFTPQATSGSSYSFASGSTILLSITSATNQGVLDPTFGGNAVGSAGYNAFVDAVTGTGNHDQLNFTGNTGSTLTLAGNIKVEGLSFTPQVGQVYNLLDWGTLVSTDFSSFNVGSNRNGAGDNGSQFDLPDISSFGYTWDVSRFLTSGVIVVIPEPSRALLLGLGMMLVLGRRRRK